MNLNNNRPNDFWNMRPNRGGQCGCGCDDWCDHHHDHPCHPCPPGPTGPTGPTGPRGATGPTGPTGASAGGAIIPFASGPVVTFASSLVGESLTAAAIGFGSATNSILLNGVDISLLALDTQAYSMPRDGVITSIAAYCSITVGLSLPVSTATVYAELYQSIAPDDDFSPVPGTLVILAPSLTGFVAVGTVLHNILEGLSIPVSAETRLMLVFTVDITAGVPLATGITAHVGGGVAIS